MNAPAMTPQECRTQTAWVLRLSNWGTRSMVVVAILALVFTMVNVQVFAAAGHGVSSFEWWIAWLLDPMASITLGTAIVFEGLLAGYGRKEGWLTSAKWYSGGCTWLMNIWVSVAIGSPAGVLLHSVAPGLVLLLAEAAPRVRRHLAEILTNLAHHEAELVAEAQRQAQEAKARQRETQLVSPVIPPAVRPASSLGEQAKLVKHQAKMALSEPVASPSELVMRARPLVAEGFGRGQLAKELGITSHQARQLLDTIKNERPALHAVAAGGR